MRELRCMLGLELRTLYGFNKFKYTKDKRAKKRYILLASVWLLLIVMVCFYIGGLVFGLDILGHSDITPAYLVTISTLIVLMFGIFRAGAVVFERSGYDILASMPLKRSSIVISRFFLLYIDDLLFTLLIMLPGLSVYAILNSPRIAFYFVSVFTVLFIPIVPLLVSLLLGTVLTAVSSRMKHKSLAESLIGIVFIIAVLFLSFSSGALEDEGGDIIAGIAENIGAAIEKTYPPSAWIGDAMLGDGYFCFVLYCLISVLLLVLSVAIISKYHDRIMRALFVSTSASAYTHTRQRRNGVLFALVIREFKRYFSSSVYVMNTAVGPIMAIILAVGACIYGTHGIVDIIPLNNIGAIIPVAFSAVLSMMPTTACSISMEGKQIDAIKALPIKEKTWIDAKLLMYYSLLLPFYLAAQICAAVFLKMTFSELLWFILFPAVNALLCGIFGIFINIKLHSFDWEREESIVKQSASAGLGGFFAVLTSGVAFLTLVLIPSELLLVAQFGILIVFLCVSALLYKYSISIKIREL